MFFLPPLGNITLSSEQVGITHTSEKSVNKRTDLHLSEKKFMSAQHINTAKNQCFKIHIINEKKKHLLSAFKAAPRLFCIASEIKCF